MTHVTREECSEAYGDVFENDHLLCCGQIRRVNIIRNEKINKVTEVKFFCERSSFTLKAVGDCCSTSWFLETNGDRFRNLVGKGVKSIHMHETEKLFPRNITVRAYCEEAVKDKKYTLTLTDNTEFVFILRNSSNGYYSGWMEVMDFKMNPSWDKSRITKNATAQVTLVVGLPASGKSHLSRTTFGGSLQLNDFYDNPQWRFKLEAYLQNGGNVVLNDPRICDIGRFKQLYNLLLKHVVSAEQIGVVSFENNVAQCVVNEKIRSSDSDKDCTEIEAYSVKYAKTAAHIKTLIPEDRLMVQPVFQMKPVKKNRK